MTSRFSSKNNKKKGQKENSVNKKKKQKEHKRKQKKALPGVDPGLSARAGNYLATAPQ